MKKVFFVIACLLFLTYGCGKTESSETVTSADFIDPGFYGYLQANYDTNGDYILQPDEVAAVKNLDLTKEDYIYNLRGLEKLTELQELNITDLKLQTHDLKISNPNLKKLSCGGTGITGLDVSELVNLEHLGCLRNNIAILDLEKNPNLTALYCDKNPINILLIDNCKNLKILSAEECPLNSLDISNNILLESLYFTIDRFMELDISNNQSLKNLSWSRRTAVGNFKFYVTQEQLEAGLCSPFTDGKFQIDVIIK